MYKPALTLETRELMVVNIHIQIYWNRKVLNPLFEWLKYSKFININKASIIARTTNSVNIDNERKALE